MECHFGILETSREIHSSFMFLFAILIKCAVATGSLNSMGRSDETMTDSALLHGTLRPVIKLIWTAANFKITMEEFRGIILSLSGGTEV